MIDGAAGAIPMGSNILLVEDDYDVREALAETLREEGYSVDCAVDGQEALDLLRRQMPLPRLILLDLMMPRMSGADFRAAQRADPILSSVPVVVLSADARMAEKARLLDAVGAIRKPIDVDDLLGTIKRLLEPAA